MTLRRGFSGEAESIAEDMRRELHLGLYKRLNPLEMAQNLRIPVWSLGELEDRACHQGDLSAAVRHLRDHDTSALSALTVFLGQERVIVHNEAHSPARQASNLAHELAHGLLLHPPAPALDATGCRNWVDDVEKEAQYLAGALLIPKKAAWWIAKQQTPFELAATEYGCSLEMVRYRVNITGAVKLLRRSLADTQESSEDFRQI